MEWDIFHDDLFYGFELDWENFLVTFNLQLCSKKNENIKIKCLNFQKYSGSKKEDWGYSNSILEIIKTKLLDRGLVELGIRLQSGDNIKITCEKSNLE